MMFALALPIVLVDAARAHTQDAPRSSLSPVVRVTLQIDSASTARFTARGFDLHVSPSGGSAAPAEIQLVKQAGAYTGSLVALTASGVHAPSAVIEVLDSLGKPTVTIRLSDIAVVSDQLSLSAARANLEQQRIAQQEALSALTTDYQEAQRQLAITEELVKTRGAPRSDLARARDRSSDLQRRIDLLKQRQTLLASQLGDQGPLDETVVLHFGKLEIENREVGGRATIDLGARPPGLSP